MITIHLMGGLGNQLFQIFATIAYAIEQNQPFRFPYSETLKTGVERPTYWHSLFNNLLPYTATGALDLQAGFLRWQEPAFHYTKIPDPMTQNVVLYGYYQSPKYFETYQSDIYQMIDIASKQQSIRAEFARYLDAPYVISMHFRLGDYKHKQQYHPVLAKEYYQRALNHILSRIRSGENPVTPVRVLFFCEAEDNAYVQSVVDDLLANSVSNVEFVKVDDTIEDWKQMLLMSCCDSQIIANSSFSWWGAYFCTNPDRIVCYPSTWFGPAMTNTNVEDLFPDTWTQIRQIA
jgi:hypothetical protein